MIRLGLDFDLTQGDFTLSVHESIEADIVALFGPSGAGKTTVLDAIAGLRRPSTGEIAVDRRLLFSSARRIDLPPRERHLGYVPQDVVLFPHMNVRRNILYGAARGRSITLEGVLEILEIEPLLDRAIASLSGGERQRVALARALMSAPALLLLDEPLSAVDVALRRRILPLLLRVRHDLGVPILYVTHDEAEVRAIADWVLLLEAGRVLASGRPADVAGVSG